MSSCSARKSGSRRASNPARIGSLIGTARDCPGFSSTHPNPLRHTLGPHVLNALDHLESEAAAALAAAPDAAAIEQWRTTFIGPKGRVKAALGATKDAAPADRPAYGKRINELSRALEERFKERRAALGLDGTATRAAGPVVDMTEPGAYWSTGEGPGRRHIIMRVREELVEVFAPHGVRRRRRPGA